MKALTLTLHQTNVCKLNTYDSCLLQLRASNYAGLYCSVQMHTQHFQS